METKVLNKSLEVNEKEEKVDPFAELNLTFFERLMFGKHGTKVYGLAFSLVIILALYF